MITADKLRARLADGRIESVYRIELGASSRTMDESTARFKIRNAKEALASKIGEAIVANSKIEIETPSRDEVSLGIRNIRLVAFVFSEAEATLISAALKQLGSAPINASEGVQLDPPVVSGFSPPPVQPFYTAETGTTGSAIELPSGTRQYRDLLIDGGKE